MDHFFTCLASIPSWLQPNSVVWLAISSCPIRKIKDHCLLGISSPQLRLYAVAFSCVDTFPRNYGERKSHSVDRTNDASIYDLHRGCDIALAIEGLSIRYFSLQH